MALIMKGRLLFVCVALRLLLANGREEVYVDPMANSCSEFNCTRDAISLLVQNRTLDEALAEITSEVTLVLNAGCHCVQSFNFVQNRAHIAILGEGETTTITCAPGLGLAFFNVLDFTLENVTIDGCGLSGSNLSDFYHTLENVTDMFFHIQPDYSIALLCGVCTDLHIRMTTLTNTLGLGLLGVNIMGTSEISKSNFSLNAPTKGLEPFINVSLSDRVGGGAIFLYHDYLDGTRFLGSVARLSVESSVFVDNVYPSYASNIELYYQYSEGIREIEYTLGGGGGLSLILAQVNYSVSSFVEGCTFQRNIARYGGGAHVETFIHVSNSSVTFSDCLFEENTEAASDILNSISIRGAGLAFLNAFTRPYNHTARSDYMIVHEPNNLILRDSIFRRNRAYIGGALIIESLHSPLDKLASGLVLFESCVFEGNVATFGAAMQLFEAKISGAQLGLNLVLDNTTMTANRVYVNDSVQGLGEISSVIAASSVNITVQNSSFTGNSGTVVHTVESLLHLAGNVVFANNTGVVGGALRLVSDSFLIIRNHSDITFQNNTAEVGGAIYVNYLSSLPNIGILDCFLFFGELDLFCGGVGSTNCVNISHTGATLTFIDNSAPLGSVLYGSTLETCPWGKEIRHDGNYTKNLSLLEILYLHYSDVFNFDKEPNTIQEVTTISSRVNLKGNPPGPVDVIPGEVFLIDVIALDRFSRKIPGLLSSKAVASYSQTGNVQSTLGLSGYWFTSGESKAPITIFGDSNQENVTVTLFTVDSFAQMEMKVNLLGCPVGFVFENSSCVCDPDLDGKHHISCNSSSKYLTVDNDFWVGIGPHRELASAHCISDYCEPGPMTFRPPDFDLQCRSGDHRTGIVCGACEKGYSNVFGTNRCLKCSNIGLLWIPLLALLGIAFVFFICYFHFTVSRGTPLSIIFYTNIFNLYVQSFTTGVSNSSRNFYPPSAWLNLDLGIQSCFYDGMDTVSRTGLNFVFPAYLYLLMFVIVFVARRSHRFSKLFSKQAASPAKLFATFMLISHTSLTETCVEVLGVTEVTTLPNKVEYRWKLDPNESYFSPIHMTLVVISILLLVFYIIPAPFILIFPNCGRKLRVFQRLTPIYDAFWAPFKPRYRFWVGLRLLLRALPLSFALFLSHPTNVICLGIFLLVLVYVQTILMPFRTTFLNAIDLFLQFNLLTLVMFTLYFSYYINQATGDTLDRYATAQKFFYGIVALAAFLAIAVAFILHVFIRFPKLRHLAKKLWQRLVAKCKLCWRSKTGRAAVSVLEGSLAQTYGATTRSVNRSGNGGGDSKPLMELGESGGVKRVQFSVLREPLLEEGELSIHNITPENADC